MDLFHNIKHIRQQNLKNAYKTNPVNRIHISTNKE